jgi:hypothetical protein
VLAVAGISVLVSEALQVLAVTALLQNRGQGEEVGAVGEAVSLGGLLRRARFPSLTLLEGLNE